MPESFQTEVDRHWAGWGRRVTWRKMEEKKKKTPLAGAKKLKWRQLGIVPHSYLAAVSVPTSGHNLLSRFLWELGKRGGRGDETRETSEYKSKQSARLERPGERGREWRGGGWWPKDRLCPSWDKWTPSFWWSGKITTPEARVEETEEWKIPVTLTLAERVSNTGSPITWETNSKIQAWETISNFIIILKRIIGKFKNNKWKNNKENASILLAVKQMIKKSMVFHI